MSVARSFIGGFIRHELVLNNTSSWLNEAERVPRIPDYLTVGIACAARHLLLIFDSQLSRIRILLLWLFLHGFLLLLWLGLASTEYSGMRWA